MLESSHVPDTYIFIGVENLYKDCIIEEDSTQDNT